MLWAFIGFSILFIVENWIVQVVLGLIGIGVSIHLLTIRGYDNQKRFG